MRYEDLLHVLRAAADHLGQADFLVIGSASILATYHEIDLPVEATRSDEADLVPFDDPDGTKADQVDGALGELSAFHDTHTYYAHGVSERTAYLAAGWRDRLVVIESPSTLTPARGHCLEAHDLAASKIVLPREKDEEFVFALLDRGLLDPSVLADRIEALPRDRVPARELALGRRRLAAWTVRTARSS